MKLLRCVILVLVCMAIALTWGNLTYQPGTQSYRAEAIVTLPPDTGDSLKLDILRKSKDLIESREFQTRAVDHLTALQTQKVRDLGPDQLVEDFEGTPGSLAESLLRYCTVYLDEITPALILSVSGESRSLVTAILEVMPDLLTKIREANTALEQHLLGLEIQQLLSDQEQRDRMLTEVVWNLKGALQAKFADRPISKRGSISSLPAMDQALAAIPPSVTDSVKSMRTRISQKLSGYALPHMEIVSEHRTGWDLLEETFRLGDLSASLVQQASTFSSRLDSATSVDKGPLPEGIKQLSEDLLKLRERREGLQQKTAALVSPATPMNPDLQHVFLVERTIPKVHGVEETDLQDHLLSWSLRGLGCGLVLSLLGFLWPFSRQKRG